MADRRYSREEAEEILARAADLEAEVPSSSDAMTMDQLTDIAREAGIDPALVRRAAMERQLAEPAGPEGFSLFGPMKLVQTASAPAPNVDLETFEYVLQDSLDDVGHGRVSDDRLSWRSSGQDGRQIQAIVRRQGDVVSFELTEKLGGLAGGLYGGIGGGLGGSLAGGLAWLVVMTLGPIAGVIYVIAAILGSLLLARVLFGRAARRRAETLEQAKRRLLQAAATESAETTETTFSLEESSIDEDDHATVDVGRVREK